MGTLGDLVKKFSKIPEVIIGIITHQVKTQFFSFISVLYEIFMLGIMFS